MIYHVQRTQDSEVWKQMKNIKDGNFTIPEVSGEQKWLPKSILKWYCWHIDSIVMEMPLANHKKTSLCEVLDHLQAWRRWHTNQCCARSPGAIILCACAHWQKAHGVWGSMLGASTSTRLTLMHFARWTKNGTPTFRRESNSFLWFYSIILRTGQRQRWPYFGFFQDGICGWCVGCLGSSHELWIITIYWFALVRGGQLQSKSRSGDPMGVSWPW